MAKGGPLWIQQGHSSTSLPSSEVNSLQLDGDNSSSLDDSESDYGEVSNVPEDNKNEGTYLRYCTTTTYTCTD